LRSATTKELDATSFNCKGIDRQGGKERKDWINYETIEAVKEYPQPPAAKDLQKGKRKKEKFFVKKGSSLKGSACLTIVKQYGGEGLAYFAKIPSRKHFIPKRGPRSLDSAEREKNETSY